MATESSSTDVEGMTPAQQLMAKHAAEEAHNPTVEDVPDEEDILHPPPSASVNASASETPAAPTPEPTMSEKAAGKQKAQDVPVQQKATPTLNTQSEEAFPSLGAPKANQPAASMWGKKPASTMSNGINGGTNGASATSRPSSGQASMGQPMPRAVNLPGQQSSNFDMFPHQMIPKGQMRRPMQHVLQDINRRNKAKIEQPRILDGKYRFEGKGTNMEAINAAFRDLSKELGLKVSTLTQS